MNPTPASPRSVFLVTSILLALVAQAPTPLSAQAPRLLRDIQPGSAPGQSVPFTGVAHDGRLFFNASHPEFGIEPWVSDGTGPGTRLLIDLAPGRQSSDPRAFTPCGAHGVVFTVWVPESGEELWFTDGTTLDTYRLLRASTSDHTPFLDGTAFTAYTPEAGSEPWFTDGTVRGTRMLRDIEPGASSSSPQKYAVIGGQVFFSAQTGATGREPWKIGGNFAVSQIADIEPGAGSSSPTAFAFFDGAALFAAHTAATGSELWRSHGTSGTTHAVADLAPGATSSSPTGFVRLSNDLYFSAADGPRGRELWRTDGTSGGTRLVVDIAAGATSSNPSGLVVYHDLLIFAATTPDAGTEPWVSDGSAAGTRQLRDVLPGAQGSGATGFAVVGAGVVFRAHDAASGNEMFFTDGTPARTYRLADLNPAGNGVAHLLDVLGGRLFFEGNDGSGWELWATNGTLPGPWLVADIVGDLPLSSAPREIVSLGELAVFVANTDAEGAELWCSDATSGGTRLLRDIQPGPADSNPNRLTVAGDRVFFAANDGVHGFETWITDGTTAGTHLVRDIQPGSDSGSGGSFTPWNDGILLAANDGVHGIELWFSDGTSAGTALVIDIVPGADGSRPSSFVATELEVFFAAAGQVWRTNGTANGTRPVNNTSEAYPACAICNGLVLLKRYHPSFGHEVWVYDRAQTQLLLDIRPGGQGSNARDFAVLGDLAYFVADDGVHGAELWRTDGTPAGTRLVADIEPGSGPANPQHLTAAASVLYFTAHTAVGRELYSCSNGVVRRLTDLGTALWPGVDGSSLSVVGLGDVIAFAGADVRGLELWTTAADPRSVRFAAEIMPGNGGGQPSGIVRVGAQLVFAANGPAGSELYAIDAAAARAAAAVSFGAGCPGTDGLVPVAGHAAAPLAGSNDFELRLTQARPRSAGLLFASFGRGALPLGGACQLLVALPALDFAVFTSAAGTARMAVPLAAGLEGAALTCQWFVFDPAGAALGVGCTSQGLEVLIGM